MRPCGAQRRALRWQLVAFSSTDAKELIVGGPEAKNAHTKQGGPYKT
jgi:hypothetical protein